MPVSSANRSTPGERIHPKPPAREDSTARMGPPPGHRDHLLPPPGFPPVGAASLKKESRRNFSELEGGPDELKQHSQLGTSIQKEISQKHRHNTEASHKDGLTALARDRAEAFHYEIREKPANDGEIYDPEYHPDPEFKAFSGQPELIFQWMMAEAEHLRPAPWHLQLVPGEPGHSGTDEQRALGRLRSRWILAAFRLQRYRIEQGYPWSVPIIPPEFETEQWLPEGWRHWISVQPDARRLTLQGVARSLQHAAETSIEPPPFEVSSEMVENLFGHLPKEKGKSATIDRSRLGREPRLRPAYSRLLVNKGRRNPSQMDEDPDIPVDLNKTKLCRPCPKDPEVLIQSSSRAEPKGKKTERDSAPPPSKHPANNRKEALDVVISASEDIRMVERRFRSPSPRTNDSFSPRPGSGNTGGWRSPGPVEPTTAAEAQIIGLGLPGYYADGFSDGNRRYPRADWLKRERSKVDEQLWAAQLIPRIPPGKVPPPGFSTYEMNGARRLARHLVALCRLLRVQSDRGLIMTIPTDAFPACLESHSWLPPQASDESHSHGSGEWRAWSAALRQLVPMFQAIQYLADRSTMRPPRGEVCQAVLDLTGILAAPAPEEGATYHIGARALSLLSLFDPPATRPIHQSWQERLRRFEDSTGSPRSRRRSRDRDTRPTKLLDQHFDRMAVAREKTPSPKRRKTSPPLRSGRQESVCRECRNRPQRHPCRTCKNTGDQPNNPPGFELRNAGVGRARPRVTPTRHNDNPVIGRRASDRILARISGPMQPVVRSEGEDQRSSDMEAMGREQHADIDSTNQRSPRMDEWTRRRTGYRSSESDDSLPELLSSSSSESSDNEQDAGEKEVVLPDSGAA